MHVNSLYFPHCRSTNQLSSCKFLNGCHSRPLMRSECEVFDLCQFRRQRKRLQMLLGNVQESTMFWITIELRVHAFFEEKRVLSYENMWPVSGNRRHGSQKQNLWKWCRRGGFRLFVEIRYGPADHSTVDWGMIIRHKVSVFNNPVNCVVSVCGIVVDSRLNGRH